MVNECSHHRTDDQGEKENEGDGDGDEKRFLVGVGGRCCLIFKVVQFVVTFDEVDRIHASNGCFGN